MTNEEKIQLGKRITSNLSEDLHNVHGLRYDKNRPDDEYIQIANAHLKQVERDKANAKEAEEFERLQWASMTEAQKAYAKASRDLQAEQGIFS